MREAIKEQKFKIWKDGLLDIGKRNRLINYRKTKLTNLDISSPALSALFDRLNNGEIIEFRKRINTDSDIQLSGFFYLMGKLGSDVELAQGEILSPLTTDDMNDVLKQLRAKANLSQEEQGINTLYLSFGFLKWKQNPGEECVQSPLILLPVCIEIKDFTSPYTLRKLDEEAIVNPTLEYALAQKHITLPKFDPSEYKIEEYLSLVQQGAKSYGGSVVREVCLGLLSYQKIVMFEDLEQHEERIFSNPIIRAFCGEREALPQIQKEWLNYSHDNTPVSDSYQVINADSSQQDAILLSQKGVSFVLYGPPGTGKSQTIANIIAAGLADHKKILFVSEKMAALNVVYHRLSEVHLAEYCLPLHNHKAEKKQVIQNLVNTLEAAPVTVKPEAEEFIADLEEERAQLNLYYTELNKIRQPLNISIYKAISEISTYESVPLIPENQNVLAITEPQFRNQCRDLEKLKYYLESHSRRIELNPWYGSTISEEEAGNVGALKNILRKISQDGASMLEILRSVERGASDTWTWKRCCNYFSFIKGTFYFREIARRITEYYSNRLTGEISDEKLEALRKKNSELGNACRNSGVTIQIIENPESRNATCAWYDELTAEARNLENEVDCISQFLGVSFRATLAGCKEITRLLSNLIDCGRIDPCWSEYSRFIKTENALLNVEHTAESCLKLREKHYNYISNTLMQGNKSIALKPLSECFASYADNRRTLATQNAYFEKIYRATLELYRNRGFEDKQSVQEEIRSATADIEAVDRFLAFIDSFNLTFESSYPYTRNGLQQIIKYISLLLEHGRPLLEWIETDNIVYFEQLCTKWQDKANEAARLKEKLEEKWTPAIYKLDCDELLLRFRGDYQHVMKRIFGTYKQDKNKIILCCKHLDRQLDDSTCIELLETLKQYKDLLEEFYSHEEELKSAFGFYYKGIDTEWEIVLQGISAGQTLGYFNRTYGMTAQMRNFSCQDYHVRYEKVIGEYTAGSLNESSVFEELDAVLQRYGDGRLLTVKAERQQKVAQLRQLYSAFENLEFCIQNELNECACHGEAYSVKNGVTIKELAAYSDQYDRLCGELEKYSSAIRRVQNFIQSPKVDFETDWAAIHENYYLCKPLFDYFNNKEIPDAIKGIALQDRSAREQLNAGGYTLLELAGGEQQERYQTLLERYPDGFETLYERKNKFSALCADVLALKNELQAIVSEDAFCPSVDSCLSFLDKWKYTQELLRQRESSISSYASRQGFCHAVESETNLQGLKQSDWNCLKQRAEQFCIEYVTIPVPSLQDALSSEIREQATFVSETENDYQQFLMWFPDEKIEKFSLGELVNRVTACENQSLLADWLNYRNIVRQCIKDGLGPFLKNWETSKTGSQLIIKAYRKGVLSRWYAEIIREYKLRGFQWFDSYEHEKKIERFAEHDQSQFVLSQAKLNEVLTHEKPRGLQTIGNAMDEVSILQKENQKRSRVMPLRILFQKIPNLLQKLKPCFMMSPLSVSYFLDSDIYEFDMVIFDEASQILPEDAIGAIYRGKQVIIAGDENQMPPSSFFTANTKASVEKEIDEDDDEYYLDSIISESVLEEAKNCMPTCKLNWHYRSKDESLIAFSNREIYGNDLITFPNCKKQKDYGLEYIYVPNGYYEGKPKNCNINEARRVVELVEEHIRLHRDRSLGIIAFSEKQQKAIENEILNWRMKNPFYEDFFTEDSEEPFFVKNLENVQGDERDTIIFSICYARNKQGRMFKRFGPLGLAGGERRLNVAITRAKYNVKLVGSIYPNDMDLKDDAPLGVRLLQKYISYAIENDYELPLGTDALETNDRFADQVARYLCSNGYQVRRNVGSSKYKIDIAIIDPRSPNAYCAGIECDGVNYTSARTARERDVTRHDIMEKIGWNLLHVWAIDWMNQPDSTKKGLLKQLDAARRGHCSARRTRAGLATKKMDDLIEEEIFNEDRQSIDLPVYHTCSPNERSAPKSGQFADFLKYVLNNECPIHEELLAKRMASYIGRTAGATPVEIVQEYLRKANGYGIYEKRGPFWYRKDQTIVARKPRTDDERRKIEYICPEEIQDAIKQNAGAALSLDIKDLFSEVGHCFGYSRSSPNMKTAFQRNLDILEERGIVRIHDEKVSLKEN